MDILLSLPHWQFTGRVDVRCLFLSLGDWFDFGCDLALEKAYAVPCLDDLLIEVEGRRYTSQTLQGTNGYGFRYLFRTSLDTMARLAAIACTHAIPEYFDELRVFRNEVCIMAWFDPSSNGPIFSSNVPCDIAQAIANACGASLVWVA